MATFTLPARRVSYGEVLRIPAFRAMFTASSLSLLGDRAATVALMVLVFDRSGSPLLTAATYAASYLPYLWAAPLATLADRFSRRTAMIVCDFLRAVAVAAMLLPGASIAVLISLVAVIATIEPVAAAALTAATAERLDEQQLLTGTTLYGATGQLAQVGGYLTGGLLVAALSPTGCLLLDVGTFLASALVVRRGLPRDPPRPTRAGPPSSALRTVGAAARLLWRTPRLRRLFVVMCVVPTPMIVPETLAVPTVDAVGAASVWTGPLIAAVPLGVALGGVLVGRVLTPRLRDVAVGPLVLLSGAPLVLAATTSARVGVTLVLWVLAGIGGAAFLLALGQFVAAVPSTLRATAHGLLSSAVMVAQGASLLGAGALAEVLRPATVVALSGTVGVALALRLGIAGVRRTPSAAGIRGRHRSVAVAG